MVSASSRCKWESGASFAYGVNGAETPESPKFTALVRPRSRATDGPRAVRLLPCHEETFEEKSVACQCRAEADHEDEGIDRRERVADSGGTSKYSL